MLLLSVSLAIAVGNAFAECEEEVTSLPSAPNLQLSVSGTTANASWSVVGEEILKNIMKPPLVMV